MMARRPQPIPEPTPRWSTWPGAVALGVGSLVLVIVPAMLFGVYATLPSVTGSGTDRSTSDAGPPLALRILALLWALAILALPPLTVRWARKKWAGWLLVGIVGSVVAFITGLFAVGIL